MAERIFDNISLLRDSEPTNSNEIVFIKGHSSNSDGGEGYFKWVPTLLKEDNNGTYIKVNTLVTGRWERAFNSGKINALFFGLRDGEYDNTDVFRNILKHEGSYFIPKGKTPYIFNGLTIDKKIELEFEKGSELIIQIQL